MERANRKKHRRGVAFSIALFVGRLEGSEGLLLVVGSTFPVEKAHMATRPGKKWGAEGSGNNGMERTVGNAIAN